MFLLTEVAEGTCALVISWNQAFRFSASLEKEKQKKKKV